MSSGMNFGVRNVASLDFDVRGYCMILYQHHWFMLNEMMGRLGVVIFNIRQGGIGSSIFVGTVLAFTVKDCKKHKNLFPG
jgi:hypothetical protein